MITKFKIKKAIYLLVMCILLSIMVTGCNQQETTGRTIDEVDLDLSALGPVMSFAVIQNITMAPEEHLETTIRVTGEYFRFFSPDVEDYVHFIFIYDEGGCCVQGFEIRMKEGWTDLEEFPDVGEYIEVVGVYSSSEENERRTFYLEVYKDDFTVITD